MNASWTVFSQIDSWPEKENASSIRKIQNRSSNPIDLVGTNLVFALKPEQSLEIDREHDHSGGSSVQKKRRPEWSPLWCSGCLTLALALGLGFSVYLSAGLRVNLGLSFSRRLSVGFDVRFRARLNMSRCCFND
jgi:hypothetical protein